MKMGQVLVVGAILAMLVGILMVGCGKKQEAAPTGGSGGPELAPPGAPGAPGGPRGPGVPPETGEVTETARGPGPGGPPGVGRPAQPVETGGRPGTLVNQGMKAKQEDKLDRLDDAWKNIKDQIQTYMELDSLSGNERIRAGTKLIFGFEPLHADVDYFVANAPTGDPRRPGVERLKSIMDRIAEERAGR